MNIIKLKKLWLGCFVFVLITGISLLFVFKPVFGIDFTGGSLIEIKLKQELEISDLRKKAIEAYPNRGVVVQNSGNNQYIIRAKTEEGDYESFKSSISDAFPDSEILRHENIGSTVGRSLAQKAIYGVILACILIILYLAYAFRSVPRSISPWAFGTVATLALIHDLVFTVAIYSVIGHFLGFEFEGITIVAILTILGFSVHDTIVVFDRIRENLIKQPQNDIATNADKSIDQTIARSLNTSLTVIVVLISMYLLGGTTTRPFVLALIIGMSIGTYSSIFVASPLLVKYIEYMKKKTS